MIVEAKGLFKRFGELQVLRDLSLRIAEGDHMALLGPSGCGKTTLLRILLGLASHDEGTVSSSLSRAGYLPQDALLFPWKTVMANLELPMQIAGTGSEERQRAVRDKLERFGLRGFEAAFPHELSGGMRQRAALLRAVLAGAESLVLDEPFGALDTLTRHRLQQWLLDLVVELDQTLVFVTHDVDEAVILAKRVVLLTERPASVLGERMIHLNADARRSRHARGFAEARDDLLRLILREDQDGGQAYPNGLPIG